MLLGYEGALAFLCFPKSDVGHLVRVWTFFQLHESIKNVVLWPVAAVGGYYVLPNWVL